MRTEIIVAARPTERAPSPALALFDTLVTALAASLDAAEETYRAATLDATLIALAERAFEHASEGYALVVLAEASALAAPETLRLAEVRRQARECERRLKDLADVLMPDAPMGPASAEMAVCHG